MSDRARIKNKAKAIVDWAAGWEGFDGLLKLNALINRDGDASVNIVPNDKADTTFIDGTARRTFTAQVKAVLPWSDGNDAINSDAVAFMSSLMDWVCEQWPSNIPVWPGAKITEITTVENVPYLNYVNQQDGLAEYTFQILIRYEE